MRGFAAALLIAAALCGHALAHAMPNSTVRMVASPGGMAASVSIPVSELEAALRRVVRPDDPAIAAYLREHVALRSGEHAWALTLSRLEVTGGAHGSVEAELAFTPPPGAAVVAAELRYDAVIHRIASHYVLVYWNGAPLARLQLPQKSTAIPLRSQSP